MESEKEARDSKRVAACAGICLLVITGVGLYAGFKTGKIPPIRIKVGPVETCKKAAAVAEDIAEARQPAKATVVDLTGVLKTATGLGDELHLSNREVNKRLVEAGMVTKEPYGYKLTELGKNFGIVTDKMRAWGHPFSNCEWDTSVIPLICSAEEIARAEEHKALIEKIAAND